MEKDRKRQAKKDKERKLKTDLRSKMSVIASTDLNNKNDEILFDRRTFEKLQNMDIENLEYEDASDQEDPDKKLDKRDELKMDDGNEDGNSDDEDMDENVKRVDAMANEIDHFYKQKREYAMEKDRTLAKREKK